MKVIGQRSQLESSSIVNSQFSKSLRQDEKLQLLKQVSIGSIPQRSLSNDGVLSLFRVTGNQAQCHQYVHLNSAQKYTEGQREQQFRSQI
ncbi:hypothetical protein FGO68_gene3620 [Halteria grandinella]|uniref:Uncharacterized protein n=1 Tax=Halteria grandinella TaxID=5974 RepID=A0A8J8TAW7_HALGN|nr:hypothetical protein FGO68_gene3620 [Halteria grandinella]